MREDEEREAGRQTEHLTWIAIILGALSLSARQGRKKEPALMCKLVRRESEIQTFNQRETDSERLEKEFLQFYSFVMLKSNLHFLLFHRLLHPLSSSFSPTSIMSS